MEKNNQNSLKIAFVVYAFPTVSETFIINQITGLLDLGHEVTIYASSRPQDDKIHPIVEQYQLLQRTRYHPDFPAPRILRYGKIILKLLSHLPKHHRQVVKTARFFWRNRKTLDPRKVFWLLDFINRDYDIFHCHFGPNGLRALDLKCMGIPGKQITTFHGYDVNQYPRQAGPKVYDSLFEKGDLFTANTEFTKQQAIKLGCPAEKIPILPMGLNLEMFKYKPRRLDENVPVKILTIGRLVEKKGYPYALQAIAQLNLPPDSYVYDIAGDGPLREIMQHLAIELNIDKQVNFLGSLSQDKILDLYHQAHIFLLPSVTAQSGDMEGQGLVLQEAQATGLPVITTWHNGIPDGVLDGQSGFLVPERDPAAIAEKIRFLIENPETWLEMGRAGRNYMEKNYDINALNRKLVDIYQSVT